MFQENWLKLQYQPSVLDKEYLSAFFSFMDLSSISDYCVIETTKVSCYPNQPSVLMKVNETLNPNYQQLPNNYPSASRESDWSEGLPNWHLIGRVLITSNFLQPHDEQLILQSSGQKSRLFPDCLVKLLKIFAWRLSLSLLYSSTFLLFCWWLLDC